MSKLTKKKLEAWQDAKAALDEAKASERELRDEISSAILGDKIKGAVHFKKFGLDATATAKLNEKLDAETLKSIFKKLSVEEKACIRYKPELVAAEYKKLPKDSIFHKAVVAKPGTSTLKIEPIKE